MLKELLNQLTGQGNQNANAPKTAETKDASVAKEATPAETTGTDNRQTASGEGAPRRTTRRTTNNRNTNNVARVLVVQQSLPVKALNKLHRAAEIQIMPIQLILLKVRLKCSAAIIARITAVIQTAIRPVMQLQAIMSAPVTVVTFLMAMAMYRTKINIIRAKKISL